MPKLLKLISAILLCEGAGILGSVFTFPAISSWYIYLNKPPFNPPNYLFGPVWTILYFLMGLTLYLLWTKKKTDKGIRNNAYVAFFVQLILNVIWSLVFFGLHNLLAGFLIIIILWIAILETIRRINLVDKTAANLLYPYLAWVSFATILNLSIVLLNP
ncbi:MAG: TspO/MBR family protein [Microgenomates group bacterium]|jgi:tryptophan-rich sensory protein